MFSNSSASSLHSRKRVFCGFLWRSLSGFNCCPIFIWGRLSEADLSLELSRTCGRCSIYNLDFPRGFGVLGDANLSERAEDLVESVSLGNPTSDKELTDDCPRSE